MAPEPFTAIGRIARTHGLKGEVSVVVDQEASLDVLVGIAAWVVPPPSGLRQTRITGVRPGPKGPLFALEGVDSINAARELTGRELMVQTSALPDEWFAVEDEDEFLGLVVTDEVHGLLGEVVEVIVTGANDVWVVEGELGEVLIPVIDDVVLEVDWDAGTAQVRLLEGLLDMEGEDEE